jgi:hypothetical protein
VTVAPETLRTQGVDALGKHMVQHSFHPNADGHAQLGACLTEFIAAETQTAACVPTDDGTLRAVS